MEEYLDRCTDVKRQTLDFDKDWITFFNKKGAEEFLHCLNQWIAKRKVPLPASGITEEDALEDFVKLCNWDALKQLTTDTHPTIWTHTFDYKSLENKRLPLLKRSNYGNK